MQDAPQEESYPDSAGAAPGKGAMHSLPPAKVANLANLEVALGIFHVWSTVLHTDVWVCSTEAQARVFRAEGTPAYSPGESILLGQLKARDPAAFAAKLQALHPVKQIYGAKIEALELDVPPRATSIFQTRPDACYACGTTRRWRSIYGVVVCRRCHPPADAALVTAWEGEDMETTRDTHEREIR